MGKFSRVIWGKVLRFNRALTQKFFDLTGPLGPKAAVSSWEPLGGRVQRVQRVLVSLLRSDEYEDSVTGFTFVTPVVHADES